MVKNPLLTVLNFSGGKQSSCILWMVLRGDLPRPEHFVVLNADPGMENAKTYDYINLMFEECHKAGIEAHTVEGPNLYSDLTTLHQTNKKRLDNPPYWTKDSDGKRGRLKQKCTNFYKIKPMDRAVRRILQRDFNIPVTRKRIGYGIVEKWIGFSYSEVERIKPSSTKYIRFSYPLIDLKMSNTTVMKYFIDNDLPIPPRSVCNACFANGIQTLKEMYLYRPKDWNQAIEVDNAIRDLQQIKIKNPVFVSSTLVSLEDLAKQGFTLEDSDKENQYSCDSGYCFV